MWEYEVMTQEQSFQNNEVSVEEALAAISAVNSELSSFQAGPETYKELALLKERLESGESEPKIIIKEVEDLRDLAREAHESPESLHIAA